MTLHVQLVDFDLARALVDAAPIKAGEKRSLAAAAADITRRWFRDRDSSHPHTMPLGGARSHYWNEAAKATAWRTDDEGFSVVVAQTGVRLHMLGGDVKPVNAQALAIPARDDAYGKLPSDFPRDSLHVVIYKNAGKAALVGPTPSRRPLFWLLKHVTINPDPSVLPSSTVYFHSLMYRLSRIRSRQESAA